MFCILNVTLRGRPAAPSSRNGVRSGEMFAKRAVPRGGMFACFLNPFRQLWLIHGLSPLGGTDSGGRTQCEQTGGNFLSIYFRRSHLFSGGWRHNKWWERPPGRTEGSEWLWKAEHVNKEETGWRLQRNSQETFFFFYFGAKKEFISVPVKGDGCRGAQRHRLMKTAKAKTGQEVRCCRLVNGWLVTASAKHHSWSPSTLE